MAEAPWPHYQYRVDIIRVIDGDSLVVMTDLGFRINFEQAVRLARINAPELNTKEGKPAKDALIEYIAAWGGAGRWTMRSHKNGRDKYGRWLADLTAPDGTDVNQWMVDNGHAVSYLLD